MLKKTILYLNLVLSIGLYSNLVEASGCIRTPRGDVSCSTLSTECIRSPHGNVACGGQATECIRSPHGHVACGGVSTECIRSPQGNVACGGDTVPAGCAMKVVDGVKKISCPAFQNICH